ncbi:MAG: 50S ribosomal protein L24 [Bacteroidota bacterium]
MHIKKGDRVLVIAGKDKGKTGEVLEVIPKKYRAIVDDVNIARKHMKPTQDNQGGIQDLAMPIHISNLMLIDPKTGDATRVGRRVENDKIVRYSKKSGETIS